MEIFMEAKRNLKYFTQKLLTPVSIVGAVLLVIGVILTAIFAGSDVRWVSFIGIAVAIVGIVLVYTVIGGRTSPSDLDYQVYERVKFLDETAQKRLEVYESHFSKVINPVTIKGYDYNTTEGLYFKKGTDNKNRTNIYNTAVIYFTKDKMHIYGKHFSLTDDLFDKEIMGHYRFVDVDRAEIIDKEVAFQEGKYTRRIMTHTFRIVKNNGDVILNMSVDYGADIDKAVEDINRVISVAKDEAAAKAVAEN